jgi:hypothetical protein
MVSCQRPSGLRLPAGKSKTRLSVGGLVPYSNTRIKLMTTQEPVMGLCEESLQQLPLNILVRWDSVEKSLQQHKANIR